MLNEILRSRWFAGSLHAGLWIVLLLLVTTALGGRGLRLSEDGNAGSRVTPLLPVAQLEKLFRTMEPSTTASSGTNPSLFATRYFLPPPKPTPTTRRLALTYHGYFRAGDGPELALIRTGDSFVNVPVGGMVVTNLYVAQAALNTLTVTNTAAETNLLKLNVRQEIEVPLP